MMTARGPGGAYMIYMYIQICEMSITCISIVPLYPLLIHVSCKLNIHGKTLNEPTHFTCNIHINTRSRKEMFHTSRITFLCSKV